MGSNATVCPLGAMTGAALSTCLVAVPSAHEWHSHMLIPSAGTEHPGQPHVPLALTLHLKYMARATTVI